MIWQHIRTPSQRGKARQQNISIETMEPPYILQNRSFEVVNVGYLYIGTLPIGSTMYLTCIQTPNTVVGLRYALISESDLVLYKSFSARRPITTGAKAKPIALLHHVAGIRNVELSKECRINWTSRLGLFTIKNRGSHGAVLVFTFIPISHRGIIEDTVSSSDEEIVPIEDSTDAENTDAPQSKSKTQDPKGPNQDFKGPNQTQPPMKSTSLLSGQQLPSSVSAGIGVVPILIGPIHSSSDIYSPALQTIISQLEIMKKTVDEQVCIDGDDPTKSSFLSSLKVSLDNLNATSENLYKPPQTVAAHPNVVFQDLVMGMDDRDLAGMLYHHELLKSKIEKAIDLLQDFHIEKE